MKFSTYLLKNRARIILRITQACILLLIVGSLQPSRPAPVVGLHREIHWLAFGGIMFLLLLLSRNRREEIRSALGVFLLGLSLEFLQHLIYRIPMEWWDVRDDTLAILAALALRAVWRVLSSRLPAPATESFERELLLAELKRPAPRESG